jgi:hypothetical protein
MTTTKHNPGAWLLGVGLVAVAGCGSADDIGFGAAQVAPVDGGMQAMGTGGRATAGGSGGAVASGGSAVSDAAPDAPVWVGRHCTGSAPDSVERCPPGQFCLVDTCAPFCRTDADCFAGYRCATAGTVCPANDPACVMSQDPRDSGALLCLRDCRVDTDCGEQTGAAPCCLPFDGEARQITTCNTDRRMCVPFTDCGSRNVCAQ